MLQPVNHDYQIYENTDKYQTNLLLHVCHLQHIATYKMYTGNL